MGHNVLRFDHMLSWIKAVALVSVFWSFVTFANMKIGTRSLVAIAALASASSYEPCPDYTTYSQVKSTSVSCSPDRDLTNQSPHGEPSTGPLGLPFMRPPPACRTFNSSAVEVRNFCSIWRSYYSNGSQKVIADMKTLLKDPDIARLFENTFPNTLGAHQCGLMLKLAQEACYRYHRQIF